MTAELLYLPEPEYRALDAVNWSTLRFMDKSPAAYQWALAHPLKVTPDMEFGTITHARLLEGAVIVPGANANRGTKAFAKEQAEYPGSLLVNDTEEIMLDFWLNGYRDNDYYEEFQKDPKIEYCIIWTDPDTGIKCKCKIDLFTDDILLDLKTTKDDTEHAYWSSFARYRTHCQFAMYRDALFELDGQKRECVVGRLEKTPPYDTIFSALRIEVVLGGQRRYKKLLRDLAECLETDKWPGKGRNQLLTDQFPEWQIERDMQL